jgi:quercetin dioxygenase-like cupin family protein
MEVVSPDDRETVEGHKGTFVTQVVDSEQMSVQHSRIDRPLRAPDHSHEQEEVGYLIEGSLTIHVDDEEHPVEAGEVFRIPGGEPIR